MHIDDSPQEVRIRHGEMEAHLFNTLIDRVFKENRREILRDKVDRLERDLQKERRLLEKENT